MTLQRGVGVFSVALGLCATAFAAYVASQPIHLSPDDHQTMAITLATLSVSGIIVLINGLFLATRE